MTSLRGQIAESLADKAYRDALVRQNVGRWFSAQLRATREGQRLKQSELGKLVGMGQTSISELETPGRRQPSLDTILRLASALDVAALVELVPYHRFVNHMASVPYAVPGISPETMNVISYEYDAPLKAMLGEDDGPEHRPHMYTTGSVVESNEEYDPSMDSASGQFDPMSGTWARADDGLITTTVEVDSRAA